MDSGSASHRCKRHVVYFFLVSLANHFTHFVGGKTNKPISTMMMKKTNNSTARAISLHLILWL
jgi:hypothetical protein